MKIHNRRRHVPVLGAAATALAIGALVMPGTAQAVWDIGNYNSCLFVADELLARGIISGAEHTAEDKSCCEKSGGLWTVSQGCTAPPLTVPPPQSPGEDVQAPGPGTATQNSPVGEVAESAAPVTSPAPTTIRYSPGWGIG